MALANFDPIYPGAIELFQFDFTQQILSTGEIISAVWEIIVSPVSVAKDATPTTKLIGTPTWDSTKTQHKIGNCVDGAIYTIKTTVTLNDGRVLVKDADLECLGQVTEPVPASAVGVAPFDYEAWITRFPEFEGIDPDKALALWNLAGVLFRNDGSSVEQDLPTRQILLQLLTAHLALRYAGPGVASGIVGRINSKSVNGVSVAAEGFGVSGTQAWLLTTQYGTDFWYATRAYRTMHYIPASQVDYRRIGPVNKVILY